MKLWKRAASLLLALVLLVGVIPVPAQAAEMEKTNIENGDMTVEGTNDLAELITQDITEQQDAEKGDGRFAVSGLEIVGNVATVEYGSLEPAIAMVAIYTEDGRQMLLSGKAEASPENTKVAVTLEGEMPQYFMAMAYMVDLYDYSPLCPAYETPMYTREMQELLDSTTDDFAPEDVLNLDDDKTTNFAVYAEGTVVIEEKPGENIVAGADYTNNTYVIENADATVTGLQPGQVVVYPYGEADIIITKVTDIQVKGTAVTITGEEATLEEAFAQMKIENTSDSSQVQVDTSTADPGVEFQGLASADPNAPAPLKEGEVSKSAELLYTLDKGDDRFKIQGSLGLKLKAELSFYITSKRQFVKINFETAIRVEAAVKGKTELEKIPLGYYGIVPVPGILIGIEPAAVFKLKTDMNLKAEIKKNIGFSMEHEDQTVWQDLSTPAHAEFSAKIEGKAFIGIDFGPKIAIMTDHLMELKLSAEFGVEYTGTINVIDPKVTGGSIIHDCKRCTKQETHLKFDGGIKAKLLKFTAEYKLGTVKLKLEESYYSHDWDEFGPGTCPHISYRTTVRVQDNVTKEMKAGVPVTAKAKDGNLQGAVFELGKTNGQGAVTGYLPKGEYLFVAEVNERPFTRKDTVRRANRVTIYTRADKQPDKSFGSMIEGSVSDGRFEADFMEISGQCSNGVTWTLYRSGKLLIQGQGEMYDDSLPPWADYRNLIKSVVIGAGVTTIGKRAFYKCSKLTSVTIPEGLTYISHEAFRDCTSLANITIPESVTEIGSFILENTAWENAQPTGLLYLDNCLVGYKGNKPEGKLEIHSGTRVIGGHALYNCRDLSSVTIPDSVITIGNSAFEYCLYLESVTIPYGVKRIMGGAFRDCTLLPSVTLPEGLIYIGGEAFSGTWLTNITIPESVTTIDTRAFRDCTRLVNIAIPENVTGLGENILKNTAWENTQPTGPLYLDNCLLGYKGDKPEGKLEIRPGTRIIAEFAFYGCNLTSVTIPDSVIIIGNLAFYHCDRLSSVTFCGSAPEAYHCFEDISDNVTAYYPAGDSTWTPEVMQKIGDDTWTTWTWIPFTPGTRSVAPRNELRKASVQHQSSPVKPSSVFDGEYGTDIENGQTIKTATFRNLVPGQEYLLLAMLDIQAADPLAAENLLYIRQAQAAEDGTLSFTYIQRIPSEKNYVAACGASNKNLKDARITFPKMAESTEPMQALPTVAWQDTVLEEGLDYVVSGQSDYTQAGTYTCYIRGIRAYTGLIKCTYAVRKFIELDAPVVQVQLNTTTGKPVLTWNQIDGAVEYEVRCAVDGAEPMLLAVLQETQMIHEAAQGGHTYTYTVRAIAAAPEANSAESEPVEITLPALPQTLPAPTLTVTNRTSTGKPYLKWTPVDGAAKYEIYRATSREGTFTRLTATSGTGIQNGSTTAGKTYYYKVRAIAADGMEGEFSEVKSRTCDLPQPKLAVTLRSGKPYLSWETVSGAVKYEVYRSVNGGEFASFYTTSSTHLANGSASAGNTYAYQVRAICSNKYGNSAFSEPQQVTLEAVELGVSTLTVTNTASNGKPYLKWTAVDGADKYEVYYSTSKTGSYKHLFTASGTTLKHGSAKAGTTYYYKVRAITSEGMKGEFSHYKLRTCDLARPDVKLSTRNVHPYLYWKSVSGAVRYEVYCSVDGGSFTRLLSVKGTKLTHSSAKSGHTYRYRVKAVASKSSANSAYSYYDTITVK